MNEKKIKHLEFIQNVIKRMTSNSFYLKGWTVTLVAAIIALKSSLKDFSYLGLSCIPLLILWMLDGFYLRQEKLYIELYDDVRIKEEEDIDFSMDTIALNTRVQSLVSLCFSKTLLSFYGGILVVLITLVLVA